MLLRIQFSARHIPPQASFVSLKHRKDKRQGSVDTFKRVVVEQRRKVYVLSRAPHSSVEIAQNELKVLEAERDAGQAQKLMQIKLTLQTS
jgi:hypothetical protein